MVKLLCLALALSIAWCADIATFDTTAAAQDHGSAEARARRHFEEGLSLARSQRWAEALSAFRSSAELVPRASTSYNIANALYRLDRPADALEELDRHAAMPEVQSNEAALEREAALRVLLVEAVAEVRLTLDPPDARLLVDGRASDLQGAKRVLRLNPGIHSLRVSHESYMTALLELQLERGSQESHAIVLQSPAPPTASAATMTATGVESKPADRKPFVKRPGFWVMIGAIVVVGVGTGVAIALTRKDDEPQCGTTGTCATTQGLTVTSF